jgi:hypothetical protein
MKQLIITTTILSLFLLCHFNTYAQETYGKTLNLGLGVGGYAGYYGYAGGSLPVFHIDYEFDVARNFTLAPFISFYKFNGTRESYTYHETVIPVGVKGTYYFDEIFDASSPWDFYAAGSLGFAIVNSHWDNGYDGDRKYYHNGHGLFLDIHIGAEYHFNNKIGAFLDVSTGVSTVGLAFHGVK